MARPIPLELPVTIATFPVRGAIHFTLLGEQSAARGEMGQVLLTNHSGLYPITAPFAPAASNHTTRMSWKPASFIHARYSARSEEHTSELQSRFDLVCRLLR